MTTNQTNTPDTHMPNTITTRSYAARGSRVARGLAVVALAVLVSVVFVASAGARYVRAASSFAAVGVSSPSGVAVDQATGEVYVGGLASENVVRYSPSGVRETAFAASSVNSAVYGVAVDNSSDSSRGDVYVAEPLAGKVLKLDASGGEVVGFAPITSASIPAGDAGASEILPVGVAVNPENGDVLVSDLDNAEVDIFNSSGVFVSQFAAGSVFGVGLTTGGDVLTAYEGSREWSPSDGYTTPTSIDPGEAHAIAGDLTTGHLFVDDGTQLVEYAKAGEPSLLQFGTGMSESFGVAVYEKTNTVYASETAGGKILVFGPLLQLATATTGPTEQVTSTSAVATGTINPEGTTVTSCRFEYGTSTTYTASVPCAQLPPLTGSTPIPVSAALAGLEPNATYHYRLVVLTSEGATTDGEDQTFATKTAVPGVDEQSFSALTQTSVILNARVNPNNQPTTYSFEYGASTTYGTTTPSVPAAIGSGYGDVNIGQLITGLQPGTTYHYRVIATNPTSPAGGTPGPDQTFTTPPVRPPVVSTGQAQNVAQNTATLTATIDTEGYETTYEFDFGADTGYGIRIFGDAGSEPGPQTFSVSLQDLAPGTTYHYRIAATNEFGTVYGADQTFTTATYPTATLTTTPPLPLLPAILLAPTPQPTTTPATAHAAATNPQARTARRHQLKRKHKNKQHAVHAHRRRHGGSRAGNSERSR